MNYFNKKGSTLAFVMIVIAILSLLGVTLLTVALAGFTMKVNEGYNKKAFYIAEGGLEQANAIIEKAMQDASVYARGEAQKGLEDFITAESDKQEADRGDKTKNYQSKYKSPYFYQRFFEPTGKYTYDYNNNLVSEFDSYGNEILPSIFKVDEVSGNFIPLDANDLNAKLDGLVESMINKKLNEYYANAYVDYLKLGVPVISDSLKEKLELLSTYNAVLYENPIKDLIKSVQVKAIKDFGVIIPDSNGLYPQNILVNEMEITFSSSAAVGEISGPSTNEKVLESTFKIGIPPYDAPVLKGNEIVKLKKNALFDKSLVSYKNIIVTGKDVTVNGNIFAKGDDTMATDNTDYLHMGGIVVGDAYSHVQSTYSDLEKEGKLTVNGTIATSGYLQTRNNNSEIIANGNVYCNSLVAQQDWETNLDGAFNNNKITLNRDLNLMDNLNLNSNNTQVTVMGSFFGFSSGSGSSALHNQSSSIAINDVEIGKIDNTTSLDIEGGGDGTKYIVGGEEKILDNGTYIAGTVYVNYGLVIKLKTAPIYGSVTIDADGGWTYKRNSGAASDADSFVLNVMNNTFGGDEDITIDIDEGENEDNDRIASNYQTGDSISISGNYLAYSFKLTDETVRSYVGDANYNAYFDFIDIPDEYFEDVPPLSLVKSTTIRPNLIVDEKSLYARMQREQDRANDPDEQFYNFGNQKIQLKNMRFSLGNFIENTDAVSDFQAMMAGSLKESVNGKMGSGNSNEFMEVFEYKEKEYKYYVNKMSDPQIDNYIENTNADLDIPDSVSKFFDFPALGLYENNSNTIYYVSGNEVNPEAISLQGPSSNLTDGVLPTGCRVALVNDNLKGIIVSKGDVYISGKINFTGTIVTEGNIYILDDNVKSFTNDYNPNLLSNTNNLVIKKIIEDNPKPDTQIGDMFRQNEEWTKEIVFTKDSNAKILNDGIVKTYTNRLNSFVKISQWKRIN